ncbi:Type-1 restriction enzyme EcoKI specificity protein [Cyanobium usitatum str. Tous]|nr:Type-1 restriction enzyme EcoKI specificity protein [Cyanobium usitatum str. Tous]
MTHKRYEKYIDTEEAWLGSHPSHWARKPLWTLFRRVKRQGFESEELLSVYRDHGVIPKSSREDNFNKPSDDLSAYQLVEPGDLAVNKMKAWQGSVAISKHRGIVSPAYHVYTSLHSENQRYLHYLMRCDRYITGYLAISKGIRVNQWDLQPEYHSRMPVLLPPLNEQLGIASFLDRETAKIDALIAEQQRLIELLQEKRLAVISHAVTKGLNPNAPMKNSGVEWLGEVPEHWDVCRVKAVSVFTTSGPRGWSERVGDVGALFVQSGDLTDVMGVDFANCKRVQVGDDAEASRTKLLDGDLVVCITGAKTGNVAVCESVPESSYVNQHLCLIRPGEGVHPRFLAALLKSGCGQTYFSLAQYGLKQGLSLEDVREAPVALPPLDEQDRICQWLRGVSSRYLPLESESQRTISLLQERRSALISAAVTGQIDVRGQVPEAVAA